MSAIEHDCKKLAFQHNLDNNFDSKQRKVSMKLMSVKSLLHTEIAPVVDSTFLLCPWNWYSTTTTVAPRLYYSPRQESFAFAAGSASSMQGMESCCQVLCVWAGLVSSSKDLPGPCDHIHTVSHNLPPSKCRCPQRHNTLWLTIKHVRILPPPLCHPDDTHPFRLP